MSEKGYFRVKCVRQNRGLLIAFPVFKQKTPEERHKLIKELKYCYLYFSECMSTHCKYTRLCLECKRRQNGTLLRLRTGTSIHLPNTTITIYIKRMDAMLIQNCDAKINIVWMINISVCERVIIPFLFYIKRHFSQLCCLQVICTVYVDNATPICLISMTKTPCFFPRTTYRYVIKCSIDSQTCFSKWPP